MLALVSPMSLASNPCTTMCRPRSWSTRHAYNGDEQEGSLANILNSNMQPVCRIVTRADSKLPTNPSSLPSYMFQSPRLLDKLDAYYNAKAHQATKKLDYLYRKKGSTSKRQTLNETKLEVLDPQQEMRLIGVLRNSLEDAGFELLNRRDIDLCDSLNAAYLLRLSIVPDVSELDGSIAREFYPEHFYANGTAMDSDELLFDGRVLVYWRGYSEEVTHGRLLLPKLDYLQASVVQRSAAWVKRRLDRVEHSLAQNFASRRRKLRKEAQKSVDAIMDVLPLDKVGITLRNAFEENETASLLSTKGNGRFKLGRYGGSKVRFVGSPYPNDALVPFTICEIFDEQVRTTSAQMPNTNATIAGAEHDMRDAINFNLYTCEYDAKMASNRKEGETMKMELLERVSINNLVDLFTRSGRRQVLKAVFEKSELVEPTYEEVSTVMTAMECIHMSLFLMLRPSGCCDMETKG